MSVIALAIATIVPISTVAQSKSSEYDQLQAFGFATCTSREDANPSTANVTGGGAYTYEQAMEFATSGEKKVRVLNAAEVDSLENKAGKTNVIKNAVRDNDIVILDGSKGDFIISSYITIQNYSNKTVLGINSCTLRTKWYVTEEVLEALEDAGVEGASTSGNGGTLTNGIEIDEEAEYLTRQTLLDLTGSEEYRNSGIFLVKRCSNMIFRNINFVGPGSIDCGGYDLLALQYTTNCWVDHCSFTDGIDGNLDITNQADLITVSWCKYMYTDRSVMHQNTSLVGSSDGATADDNKLSVTFAYNEWGNACRARMPMARMGRIHMLNNYFNCPGNRTACINPRKNSEFLIEGNYFEEGVIRVFDQKDATSYVWKNDNVVVEPNAKTIPTSKGECKICYTYNVYDATTMKDEVHQYAGVTLWDFTAVSDDNNDNAADPTGITAVSTASVKGAVAYNLAGQRVCGDYKGVVIKNGKKYLCK